MIEHWQSAVGSLPFDWAHYLFMQNALAAVLLISPVFALLGCLVINNRMAFYSDAVGHAALTGIGIGVVLGLPTPIWSMVGFAALLALVITALRWKSGAPSDTILGLTTSFTVALGVVLLSRGGNFAKYSGYLVGDLLTLNSQDLQRLGLLFFVVLLTWILYFNRIYLVTLNHTLARSRAIRVWTIEALFAVLVALVVTISIPLLGLLVINSLLILPATAVRGVCRNTPQYLAGAAAVSMVSGVCGLILSFYWGTATGATIVLVALGIFLACMLFTRK